MPNPPDEAPTVTVVRHLDLQAREVFDAWLEPSLIGRWMFGPTVRDERVRHIRLDARPGGRFSFEVERDGAVIDHVGEYLVIDRPHRLAFGWGVAGGPATRVDVAFDDDASGCRLTLTHALDAASVDMAPRVRMAWELMLDTLDRELHPVDGHVHLVAADTVRMERLLPAPIDRVWAWLTDPDKRALWLAGGPMELRPGGAVELVFRHAELSSRQSPLPERYAHLASGHVLRGKVLAVDPPHLLSFTWGSEPEASVVTIELRAQGTLVRLRLTHSGIRSPAELTETTSGWHTHADMLESRLAGHEPDAFWARHALIDALYRRREANG